MVTLGGLFTVAGFALAGGEKKKAEGPPINATSKDEENFIQYVVRSPPFPPHPPSLVSDWAKVDLIPLL